VDKPQAAATVADVGCGYGHSTVIMAEAYPSSRLRGFDPLRGSIEAAHANAREPGVYGRIVFAVHDAKGYNASFCVSTPSPQPRSRINTVRHDYCWHAR
jgi:16S rRNA G1207 methylase RsmC